MLRIAAGVALGSKCIYPHAGFDTRPVYVLDVSYVLLKELDLHVGRLPDVLPKQDSAGK